MRSASKVTLCGHTPCQMQLRTGVEQVSTSTAVVYGSADREPSGKVTEQPKLQSHSDATGVTGHPEKGPLSGITKAPHRPNTHSGLPMCVPHPVVSGASCGEWQTGKQCQHSAVTGLWRTSQGVQGGDTLLDRSTRGL